MQHFTPGGATLLFNALILTGCDDSVTGQQAEQDVEQTVERNPKKGFCITTRPDNGWVDKVESLNVSWYYSWGPDLKEDEPDSVEFVPMIWGAWGNFSGLVDKLAKLNTLADADEIDYLMGFNEPDNENQANMSIDKAIEARSKLMEVGLPLGSPGCVYADGWWMQDFMVRAEEQDLRVDFIAVHWYGGANAKNFVDYIKKIHDMYELPIWITEFAVGNWNAGSIENNRFSPAEVKSFMSQVLPWLDRQDYVERYAWFSAATDNAALGNSALFDKAGHLTELGWFYSNYQ